MEPLLELIRLLGFPAAMVGLAISTYFLIARRSNKAATDAEAAQTTLLNAVTAQYTALAADNRTLQARLDALEVKASAAEIDRVKVAADLVAAKRHADDRLNELRIAQENISRLMMEVKTLTDKVATLETERVVRDGELKRERTQLETTSHALAMANEKITGLQQRVSALESENNVLKAMFTKLNIIAVSADGKEPPPEPPPPVAMHSEKVETTMAVSTTKTDTETAA